MLTKIFILLCRFRPIKRVLWKTWYDFLAGRYRGGDWTFMNYGYAGPDSLPLNAGDEVNRHFIQLYHVVASAVDLHGLQVLEVGSGRGGGASYVMRYLGPAKLTGVDFSANAVSFCRERHRVDGLSFREGAAEALPFDAESFDVVINVESSHCYGSMDRFLREVRRVLRPGGFFLHADLRDRGGLAVWQAQLVHSGLSLITETDITANVIAALDADNDRKAVLIRKLLPRPLLAAFSDFAGMRGSVVYEGFRSGRFAYRAFKLRKES